MDSKNWETFNRSLEEAVIADTIQPDTLNLKQLDSAMAVIYRYRLMRPRIVEEFVWWIGETAATHAECFDLKQKTLVNKRPIIKVVLANHGYADNITREKTSARFNLADISPTRCIEFGNYRFFKYMVKHKSLRKSNTEFTACAARYGHFDMVKEMIKDGFAVDSSIGDEALCGGNVEMLKYAQSLGFKLDEECWENALESGSPEIINYLIEYLDCFGETKWNSDDAWKCTLWDTIEECDNCTCGNYAGMAKIQGPDIIRKVYEHRERLKPNFDIFYVCAAAYENKPLLQFLLEKKLPVPKDALRHCQNYSIIKKLHEFGAELSYVKVFQVCAIEFANNYDPCAILDYLVRNGIKMQWHYYECMEHGNYQQAGIIVKYHQPNTYTLFCDAWDGWVKRMKRFDWVNQTNTPLSLAVDLIEHETPEFGAYFTNEMAFACAIHGKFSLLDKYWNSWNMNYVIDAMLKYRLYSELRAFVGKYGIAKQSILTALAKYPPRNMTQFQQAMGYCPHHLGTDCRNQIHVDHEAAQRAAQTATWEAERKFAVVMLAQRKLTDLKTYMATRPHLKQHVLQVINGWSPAAMQEFRIVMGYCPQHPQSCSGMHYSAPDVPMASATILQAMQADVPMGNHLN